MLDDLLWKLFPAGVDMLSGITQVLLWLGALLSLGLAILAALMDFVTRRTVG